MNSDVPYRIRVLAGLAAIVGILGVVGIVLGASNGKFSTGYEMYAVFSRAGQGLYAGNDVKVRGVSVGSVQSFRLDRDDTVTVTLHLRHGVRIPESVTASIEPLSVFGPTYVNLVPGAGEASGPFLPARATISRTVPPTGLLDVLDETSGLLNAIDTTDLSTVIGTLGTALDGTGGQIAQTVDALGTVSAHTLADLPELQALLSQAASIASALGPKGADVAAVANGLDEALPAITSQPDAVTSLLDQTSQLATDLSGLLEGHQPALDQVIDGLTSVAATLDRQRGDLPPLIQSLDEFFNFVGGIIRAPGEAVPGGRSAGNLQGFLPSDPCVLLLTCGG